MDTLYDNIQMHVPPPPKSLNLGSVFINHSSDNRLFRGLKIIIQYLIRISVLYRIIFTLRSVFKRHYLLIFSSESRQRSLLAVLYKSNYVSFILLCFRFTFKFEKLCEFLSHELFIHLQIEYVWMPESP